MAANAAITVNVPKNLIVDVRWKRSVIVVHITALAATTANAVITANVADAAAIINQSKAE